jgi:hypothetical protein
MEKSLGIKSRTVVEEKKRKKKAGISKVMDASFSSSIVHAIVVLSNIPSKKH